MEQLDEFIFSAIESLRNNKKNQMRILYTPTMKQLKLMNHDISNVG